MSSLITPPTIPTTTPLLEARPIKGDAILPIISNVYEMLEPMNFHQQQ
jgi:hypothetical protein